MTSEYWNVELCEKLIEEFDLENITPLDLQFSVRSAISQYSAQTSKPTETQTRKFFTKTNTAAAKLSELLADATFFQRYQISKFSGLDSRNREAVLDELTQNLRALSDATQVLANRTPPSKPGRKQLHHTPLYAFLRDLYDAHTQDQKKNVETFIIRCVEPLELYLGLDQEDKVLRVRDVLRSMQRKNSKKNSNCSFSKDTFSNVACYPS
jgi:hypothetical protein